MSEESCDAMIVGKLNTIVSFAFGVTEQDKMDILNVMLYAQTFSTYSIYDDWHSWFHYYRNRLESRGFERKGTVIGNSVVSGNIEDVRTAVFGIKGDSNSEQLADLVRRSFKALGVYKTAEAYFDGTIDLGQMQNFHIMPCENTASDELSLLLCGLKLSSDVYSAGPRRLILHFKGGSYRFNRDTYARHRESVLESLEKDTTAYFRRLGI